MAKKRLNKAVIGGLTFTAAVVAIIAVTIVTIQNARRDPQVFAARAEEARKAGNYERAIDLYKRAFDVNKEAKYLIDAGNAAYEDGNLSDSLNFLRAANVQVPEDVGVLDAVLTRLWQFHDAGVPGLAELFREYGDKMLALQPENPVALVSVAQGLAILRAGDPSLASAADSAFEKCVAAIPDDSRVARLRADKARRDAQTRAAELARAGRPTAADEAIVAGRTEAVKLLSESLQKIADVRTSIELAQLHLEGRSFEQARAAMDQARAAAPQDADLIYHAARVLAAQAESLGTSADAAPLIKQAQALLDEGLKNEPALFEGYTLRGLLAELAARHDGSWDSARTATQKAILEGLQAGFTSTIGLRSSRALLNAQRRSQMLVQAFDLATRFREQSSDDAGRAQALEFARQYLDSARNELRDDIITPLMEGQYAMMTNDLRGAVQAYSNAEKATQGRLPAFNRLARERLAILHRQLNELGTSLTHSDQAIASYRAEGLEPSRAVLLNRAQVLTLLDRAKEALDQIAEAEPRFPNDPDFANARALALAKLGRNADAQAAIAATGREDASALVNQGRLALLAENYADAATFAERALQAGVDNPDALRLRLQVFQQANQIQEGLKFIESVKESSKNDTFRRLCDAYTLMLGEPDPAKRDARLLELIDQMPEGIEKLVERLNFHLLRNDIDKAAPLLDELERQRPDDHSVLRTQFDWALRRQQWDRAQGYVTKLAAANVDRAGGASYRGMLALARGNADEALRDLLAAEQLVPTDPALKLQIARALLVQKPARYDAVIETLNEVLEIDPRNFFAHKLLFLSFEAIGRQQEGLPHLEQAAKLNPEDDVVKQRSKLLEEERDPAKGIAWREPLRAQEPENVDNLLRLVYLYNRLGETEKAEDALKAAATLAPTKRSLAVTAATFYSQQKNRAAGEAVLRGFRDAAAGMERVAGYALLARFLETLGEFADAESVLREGREWAGALPATDADSQTAQRTLSTELAEFFARRNRLTEMVDEYRRLLSALGPSDTSARQRVRLRVVRGLLADRQVSAAEAEVMAYQSEFKDDPRGWMAEAEVRIVKNEFEPARELLTKVLTADPENQWSLYTRARLAIEARRYAEARDDLRKLKELAPGAFNLAPRLELARVFELLGQVPVAEAELREVLALQPDNRVFGVRLIELLRSAGRAPDAQRFCSEQIARNDKDPFWHYRLGLLLAARDEHTAAVEPLRKAMELGGNGSGLVSEALMDSLLTLDRAPEVIAVFEPLPAEQRTPLGRVIAGMALATQQRGDEAERLFVEALIGSAAQTDLSLFDISGRMASVLQRSTMASVVRNAVSAAGEPSVAQRLNVLLARLLIESGDSSALEEGRGIVDSVLKTGTPGTQVHVEALLTQASVALISGQHEPAVKQYEEVLRYAPNNPTALNNLAFLLAENLNRPGEALPYAERARQLSPGDPNVLDTLGWIYHLTGNDTQAESMLLEARRLGPRQMPTRYHLGVIYSESGRRDEARREFETLRELAAAAKNREYQQKAEEGLAKLR